MKRLAAIILLLLSITGLAHAAFWQGQTYTTVSINPNPNLQQENVYGLTGSAWQDTANYYNPGTGNPAVSTSDWYYVDGSYWMRPVDLLDSACGSAGSTVAAANGRYAWTWSGDHVSGAPQADAAGWWLGFSNDPGVLPASGRQILPYTVASLSTVATITADISNGSGGAGNILNVTAVTGYVTQDNAAVINGTGVTQASILSQNTGTTAKTGTYTIGGSAQLVSSRTMTVSQQAYSLGMTPYLVCNPDDASNTFYIYGEGSANRILNETGYIKSNDLVTFSTALPTHVLYSFGPFSSYQKVVRTGVNAWYSVGYEANFPQNPDVFGMARWTSSDGVIWDPVTSSGFFNTCIPNVTPGVCNGASAIDTEISSSFPRLTIGAQDWVPTRNNTMVSGVRVGSQWVSRTAIDSNFNSLASPGPVNVSAAYDGNYPGPTYVNAVNSYKEDGVLHYYANIGFPKGGTPGLGIVPDARYENQGACGAGGPPARGVVGLFRVTGQVTGTTLDVATIVNNSVVIGAMVTGTNINYNSIITGTTTTTPGFLASYTLSQSSTTSAGININGYTCGGLNQQGVDYYTEIIDATAAAGAAPVGVKASCAASTASLTWFNALPQQTYRLYRGTTAGSQTTLVGDFTGTSATDTGMTLNALTYYKLVYLHSGVEQKNRVVSTYCSTSNARVNAHLTRAQLGGADMTTCNRNGSGLSLDAFDAWLVSNNLVNNVRYATAADFCVAKSGSVISKFFDYGTTRLPRGGDFAPLTSNTTYNATGINSKPAWVNSTSGACGVFGGGRYNNIRRYKQATIFAAYQKPNTNQITPLVIGQFSTIFYISHLSGSPGSIELKLSDATQIKTATATVSGLATDVHTATGTFDGTTLLAYSDAVAGTGVTGLVVPSPKLNPFGMLDGQVDNNQGVGSNWRVLVSGASQGIAASGTSPGCDTLAQFSGRALMLFDMAITGAQVTSLDALVR